MAFGIVDGDSRQALPVAEAFHDALEVALGSFCQQRLHRFLETFGENLGAFLEFIAAGTAVRLHLVESEQNGNNGNGEDQGKDQAEAEAQVVMLLSVSTAGWPALPAVFPDTQI